MVRKHPQMVVWVVMVLIGFGLPAKAEVLDRIVAIVNNEIITLSQLKQATKTYQEKIEASQATAERKQALIKKLETDMLNNLVDASLTKQEAKKFGIQVDDRDVDLAIENVKKSNNLTDTALERGLAADGLTMAQYRERIRDQILQSMLINRAVRSKIIITDADIKTYYDANQNQFYGLRKYHLKNILTKTRDEMDTVVKALETGESIDALAKKFSIGSNADEGGELGVFDIESFSAEIRDALKDLETGEHTKVLETGGSYQIIYVAEVIKEGNQSLEEATEKIRETLMKSEGQKQFTNWIEKLKKNAHIKLMLEPVS